MIKIKKLSFHYNSQTIDDDEINHEYFERNLRKLLHNKCVYCESAHGDMIKDYFRPISGVLNTFNGVYSEEHYYWLSNFLDNIVLVCLDCSRSKSNRFAVKGELVKLLSSGKELLIEKRLLLSPYHDYPEKHFRYGDEGDIYSSSEKGTWTIDVLNLNRSTLIEQRLESLQKFEKFCFDFIDTRPEFIAREISEDAEFAGMKRSMLDFWIRNRKLEYKKEFKPFIKSYLSELVPIHLNRLQHGQYNNHKIMKEFEEQINLQEYLIHAEEKSNFNIVKDDRDNISKYYSKQRYLETIEIKNFRNINYLHLDLRNVKSKDAPWLMVLGENGVGKSSLLQAITIALVGEEKREMIIDREIPDYLKQGEKEGYIRITLSGMKEAISLIFNEESTKFIGENEYNPMVFLLAYGSTRLLSRGKLLDESFSTSRVRNLFDPFVPMVDAEEFLVNLSESEFGVVVRSQDECRMNGQW